MDATLSVEEARKANRKEVVSVTIILSVITIVELILGFIMMPWPEDSMGRHLMKGIIIILMLVKGFYIAAHFMHLKHEVRNLIVLISTPLLLFPWFIFAFMYDGHSHLKERQLYYKGALEINAQKAPAMPEEGHEANLPH